MKNEKWKSRYPVPNEPRLESPPELPEGWTWATVDQLAAREERAITDGPFGSNLKSGDYTDTGPRVVRLQNIGDGIFIDEPAHISEDRYELLIRFAVFPGDLVIRTLGTPSPRACKIPENLGPAIVKADCIRFKVASEYFSPDFVMWALNSPPIRARTEHMIHGTGRPRLNLGEIRSIPIPIPPLEEQLEVSKEIEHRLTARNQLVASLDQQIERSSAMREILLREAVTGQLVSQDPTEEPASILLARINASKTAEAMKPKEKHMPRTRSTLGATRRPLFDVLSELKEPITPEQLFRDAGFKVSEIDLFYHELASLRDRLIERRPMGNAARAWPDKEHVTLQLKDL